LAFPEMAVTGYPPEDLLLMPKFIEANLKAVRRIAKATSSIAVLLGFVDKKEDIFNAAALLQNGKVVTSYCKTFLPNYGVFDEDRYFKAGTENFIFVLKSVSHRAEHLRRPLVSRRSHPNSSPLWRS